MLQPVETRTVTEDQAAGSTDHGHSLSWLQIMPLSSFFKKKKSIHNFGEKKQWFKKKKIRRKKRRRKQIRRRKKEKEINDCVQSNKET